MNYGVEFLKISCAFYVYVVHFKNRFLVPYRELSDPSLMETIFYGLFSLSSYAVLVFFIISGYFVSGSMENKSLKSYARSRFLRIYPVYIVSLFITIIIEYFITSSVVLKSYILSLFFLNIIPGANPLFNGSLWTMPHEVLMYIFLYMAIWMRRSFFSGKALEIFAVFVFIVSYLLVFGIELLYLPAGFFLGVFLSHSSKSDRLLNLSMSLIMIVIVGFSLSFFMACCCALIFVGCLRLSIKRSKILKHAGELTYSLYALHYPLIMISYFIFQENPTRLADSVLFFCFLTLVVLFVSLLINKFIENRFLALKRLV